MVTYSAKCSAVGGFSYASNFKLYVVLTESDVKNSSNTSDVKYNVYCEADGSGSINAKHLRYFKINGKEIINSTTTISASSPDAHIAIASGTLNDIGHNSDGSKSISYSAKIKASSYGVSASLSGVFNLTKIPRQSNISCSSGYIGSSTTLNISSNVSSYTHDVFLTIAGVEQSNPILSNTSGGSHSFTIPTSVYATIPNSTSTILKLRCRTKSGSTHIGSDTFCNFTATVDSSNCTPRVDGILEDTNPTSLALTGNNKYLVKNLSNIKVTANATVQNSANISSLTINGSNVSNGGSLLFNNTTADFFSLHIKDTRGFSAGSSVRPEKVIDYVPVSVAPKFSRVTQTGSRVQLSFDGKYFNGNFGKETNSLTVRWSWKKSTDTEYSAPIVIDPTLYEIKSDNTFSSKTVIQISDNAGLSFDYKENYDFRLEVIDKVGTFSETKTVSVGIPNFYLTKDSFVHEATPYVADKNDPKTKYEILGWVQVDEW